MLGIRPIILSSHYITWKVFRRDEVLDSNLKERFYAAASTAGPESAFLTKLSTYCCLQIENTSIITIPYSCANGYRLMFYIIN